MSPRRWLLCTLALAGPALAHGQAAGPRGLLLLEGNLAPALYAPGALDRASHAQQRFGLLAEAFAGWSDRPTPLPLLVVAPEDWAAAGVPLPLGMPGRTAAGELALPAWGDPATVKLWSSLLAVDDLAAALGAPAGEPVRGTRAESASLAFADLGGQLVASRLLVDGAGFTFAPPGCGDLVAAVVARTAFARYEPHRLPELQALFARLADGVEGASAIGDTTSVDPARQLAAWARLYLVIDTALATAGNPEKVARAILRAARDREGPLLVADVWKRLPDARAIYERAFVVPVRE